MAKTIEQKQKEGLSENSLNSEPKKDDSDPVTNTKSDHVIEHDKGLLFNKHNHLHLERISTSDLASETIVAALESKLFAFFANESFNDWVIPKDIVAAAYLHPSNAFLNNHLIHTGSLHALIGGAINFVISYAKVSEPGEVKKIYPDVSKAVIHATYTVLDPRTDIDEETKKSIFDSLFMSSDQISAWDSLKDNESVENLQVKHTYVYQVWYDYMVKTISGKNYITAAPTLGVIADFLKSQKEQGHLAELSIGQVDAAEVLKMVKDIASNKFSTDIVNAIKVYELTGNWISLVNSQSESLSKYIAIALYMIAGTEVVPIPAFLADTFMIKSGVFGQDKIVNVEAVFGKPIELTEASGLDFVSDISHHEWLTFADAAMNCIYQPSSIWSLLDRNVWGMNEDDVIKSEILDYMTYWRRQVNNAGNIYRPVYPEKVIKLISTIGSYLMAKRLFTGELVSAPFSVKGAMQYERTSFENFDMLDKLLSVIYTVLDSFAEAIYFCIGIGVGYFKRFGADLSELPEIYGISKELFNKTGAHDVAKLLGDATIFKNFRKSVSDTMELRQKKMKAGLAIRESLVLELLSSYMTWMPVKCSLSLPDPFTVSTEPFAEEHIYNYLVQNWKYIKPKTFRNSVDITKFEGYLGLVTNPDFDKGKQELKSTLYLYGLAGLIPHIQNPKQLVEMGEITTITPFTSIDANTQIMETDSDLWKLGRDVRYDLVSRIFMYHDFSSDQQSLNRTLLENDTFRRLIESKTLKLIPLFSYVNLAAEIGLDLSPQLFIKKFPLLAKEWFTKEAFSFFSKEKNAGSSIFIENNVKQREFKAYTAAFLNGPLEDTILLRGAKKPYIIIDVLNHTTDQLGFDGTKINKAAITFGDTVVRPYFYKFVIDKVFLSKTDF